MGTRNITQVILNGKTLVSQYCQWDGYPEGQGATVLEFLKGMDRELFERRLRACTVLDEDIIKAHWDVAFSKATIAKLNEDNEQLPNNKRLNNQDVLALYKEKKKHFDETGLVGMDVSNEFSKNHPTLIRDMGAEILQYIQDSTEPVDVKLDLDFVKDSVFCEWAYVIDLDNNILEVFGGCNQTPVPADNRFQPDEPLLPKYEGADLCYPVSLIYKFDINNLPDEETFVKLCTPPDEDEELTMDLTTAKLGLEKLKDSVNLICNGEETANKDTMIKMVNYLEANIDDFIDAYNN